MCKQGEDEQAKLFFRSNMIAMFAQEGVREVVLSDHRIPVGLEGVDMENLRRMHSPETVEKAITAWNLIITTITYMPVLTQIIADGSPSGGWKLFLAYYEPQGRVEKTRLTSEYHAIKMRLGETPQEYFGQICCFAQ